MAAGTTGGAGDRTIRVVWGTATGPTALASYDAALAEAGVENYNLVHVSSVVPAAATVESVGTVEGLGEAGNRLTVVEARATVGGEDRRAGEATVGDEGADGNVTTASGDDATDTPGTAGLAWAVGPGPGIFYEVGGRFDEAECRRRLETGLAAGCRLREWTFETTDDRLASVEAPSAGFATAVVLGVYGRSEPVL